MSVTYYYTGSSGTAFSTAVRQGAYQISTPLGARAPTHRVIEQSYRQLESSYSAPSTTATCPFSIEGGSVTAYWVDDTPRVHIGGGMVEYTRRWATIPSQIVDYSIRAVEMPALAGYIAYRQAGASTTYAVYPYLMNDASNTTKTSRTTIDFFHVPATYASPLSVTAYSETIYTQPDILANGNGPLTYYTGATNGEWDYLILNSQSVGMFSGAIRVPSDLTPSVNPVVQEEASQVSGWWKIGSSNIERYMGNIWMRAYTEIDADS